METSQKDKSLLYRSSEPDIASLRTAFNETTRDLSYFFNECRRAYDDRRNYWPGKSRDLRKHGGDAFPWEGAADMEAHVIDERINAYVALFMSALKRANIRAYPVEFGDLSRARVVSSFLKWMVSSYIPRFKKEMELAANYLLERGILVTYVGWQKEDRTYLQKLELQQLVAINPKLAQAVLEGEMDDQLVEMIKQFYPNVTDSRAKQALKDLRKEGVAEIPVVKRQVNCPLVQTLSPDGEFFFPAWATDPQNVPYCFWRTYYTPQELKNKVSTDGWNEEWVDTVIEKYKGQHVDVNQVDYNDRRVYNFQEIVNRQSDLVEVIFAYQRLIDPKDNSEGIYCTVFHRDLDSFADGSKAYAKSELLNGYEDYPIVVTRLAETAKRLYDVQNVPQILRGIQWQVKTERDSRIDRNSLATLPPIMHPVGNAPADWGPGRYVPYRRQGEFQFGPTPPYNPGSEEMENTMLRQADIVMGLDVDNPLSQVKQQYYVDKFLEHVRDVIKLAFKCYQRFGPESTWFRVTGVPDPQKFDKGNPDENFDVVINFDVLNQDPETMEAKLGQLQNLVGLDKNGRINVDMLLEAAAGAIDPVMADAILQPAQQAQAETMKNVTDDLTRIFSGIETPARPNGASLAMQYIQQYTQQPDVAQRLQNDKAFAQRLQKYAQQYQFQMQQAQNAQIGRIGTQPAAVGSVQTQNMAQ